MSDRHLFNSTQGLVAKSLRGFIRYNPSLTLDPAHRIVFDSTYNPENVALISGGGSGHEPAWSGYVGQNMLTASVAGDIFASPSTKQVLTAVVDAVPSKRGTILVITNYTGDCLHFGLAAEKASAAGHETRMIICGDDVSVGRTRGSMVGRRGLAGQIGVLKVMGAAAGAGASLDEVYDLGTAFAAQIVSIAATLDHCHVPGRKEHGTLEADVMEIGTGPHNEPGVQKVSPVPEASELVQTLLKNCLDETDPERGYVKFQEGDEMVLLVSNFGGMSYLEMGALVDELLEQLSRDWKMEPVRVYSGFLETSLNAPAFSISVVNISAVAMNCKYSVKQINEFLDARTNTHWEGVAGSQGQRRPRAEQVKDLSSNQARTVDDAKDLKIEPKVLEAMVRTACNNLVESEPDLTRWDMIMGDGDCGLTLEVGAKALLEALDKADLAASGSVVKVLHKVEDIVEGDMGGTLGGILGIFFVALRSSVERNAAKAASEGVPAVWAVAVTDAIRSLERYTPAKVGDRTVMDTLIPFAEALAGGGLDAAEAAAIAGADKTRTLQPRLGRATYVGTGVDDGKELPPDPGAWGAMVAIKGLKSGLS